MTNCTLVGKYADCPIDADGVFCFGDFAIARPGEKVVVGDRLFGKFIPTQVRNFIINNPRVVIDIVRNGRWHELARPPISDVDWWMETIT